MFVFVQLLYLVDNSVVKLLRALTRWVVKCSYILSVTSTSTGIKIILTKQDTSGPSVCYTLHITSHRSFNGTTTYYIHYKVL